MQPDSPSITGSWHFLMDVQTALRVYLCFLLVLLQLSPFSPHPPSCAVWRQRDRHMIVCVCVWMCVFVRERYVCLYNACISLQAVYTSLEFSTNPTHPHTQKLKHLHKRPDISLLLVVCVCVCVSIHSKCTSCGYLYVMGRKEKEREHLCAYLYSSACVKARGKVCANVCLFHKCCAMYSICM